MSESKLNYDQLKSKIVTTVTGEDQWIRFSETHLKNAVRSEMIAELNADNVQSHPIPYILDSMDQVVDDIWQDLEFRRALSA